MFCLQPGFCLEPRAAALNLFDPTPGGPAWTHDQNNATMGPAAWASLYPTSCASTSAVQSPIFVNNASFARIPSLTLKYHGIDGTIQNTGHFIGVQYSTADQGKNYMSLHGVNLPLTGLHLHTPSEHYIDGMQYEGEIHLVHQLNGETVVIAIMVRVGTARVNDKAEQLFLQNSTGTPIKVNAADLLPSNATTEFYTYVGSLTTPPCTAPVTFYVLKNSIEVKAAAISAMRATISTFPNYAGWSANNRPTQSPNKVVLQERR